MDIDFSLVLVNLSLLTGLIYLLDIFLLAPKRRQQVASFEAADNTKSFEHKQTSESLAKEPVWVEYAKSLFPVFFLVLLFRSFIAEPFTIPSESMLPTLEVGDYIVVNKFSYGFRLPVIGTKIKAMDDPKRGDVMVFKFPENPKINFIKRVIGVPGDTVKYENKRLYINGEKVEEILMESSENLSSSQARHYIETIDGVEHSIRKRLGSSSYNNQTEWIIPEGHYFVMGDNRDNSNDSRF